MKTLKTILTAVALMAAMAVNAAETIDNLRQKADRMHAEGKNDSALLVAEEALSMALQAKDTVAIVGINSSMGVYLRTEGRLDEALVHYDTAMKLCTDEGFTHSPGDAAREEAAVLYLNLATLHVDMQHKDEALRYAKSAANWALKCADGELKAQLLAQDGLIFLMCGDGREAARLLSASYRLAMKLRLYPAALNAGAYMIAVADRTGDAAAVDLWRTRCRQIEGKVTDTMAIVAYLQIQCSVAMKHEKWHEAIGLFNRILATKGVKDMPFVVFDCYNNMHLAWAALGDWHKAYDCLGQAMALKDSLFEKDKAESLRKLNVKYKAKERELALARSETELAQTRMYTAIGLLVVLVCAVLVALYVQRQRRRMRRREAEFARLKADVGQRLTRRYIEGLESERERLARELHDGVCNDLYTAQVMAGNMAGDRQGLPEKLDEIRCQVRRVSHELLPPEFKYADVCTVMDDYLNATAEASGREIRFEPSPADADWGTVSDATSLELYRIMQEAVGNAVKHSGATSINVRLEMRPGTLTLTVTDNGTQGLRHSNGGIGSRTMRQRAEAIGGKMTLGTDEGGTTLSVTVSIEKRT